MPKMQELAQQLVTLSPAQYTGECDFRYYPVCNEYHWVETYESLAGIVRPRPENGVALIFGESHFISLLPLLQDKGIGLLVLADIQPLLHKSNKKLLDCFDASATWRDFLTNWRADAEYFRGDGGKILEHFRARVNANMLGKYHFLASEARYLECKRAREEVTICQMNVDLFDSDLLNNIAVTVNKAQARIELINLTNICCYDTDYEMKSSVSHLLKHNLNALITYSKSYPGQKGKLISKFARGFSEYRAYMDERRTIDFLGIEKELDSAINALVVKFLNLASPYKVNFVRNDMEDFCRVIYVDMPQYDQFFNVQGFFTAFQSLNFAAPENEDLNESRLDLVDARQVYVNYANIPGTEYHPEKLEYADLVLNKTRPVPQSVQALNIIQVANETVVQHAQDVPRTTSERAASFL